MESQENIWPKFRAKWSPKTIHKVSMKVISLKARKSTHKKSRRIRRTAAARRDLKTQAAHFLPLNSLYSLSQLKANLKQTWPEGTISENSKRQGKDNYLRGISFRITMTLRKVDSSVYAYFTETPQAHEQVKFWKFLNTEAS